MRLSSHSPTVESLTHGRRGSTMVGLHWVDVCLGDGDPHSTKIWVVDLKRAEGII